MIACSVTLFGFAIVFCAADSIQKTLKTSVKFVQIDGKSPSHYRSRAFHDFFLRPSSKMFHIRLHNIREYVYYVYKIDLNIYIYINFFHAL